MDRKHVEFRGDVIGEKIGTDWKAAENSPELDQNQFTTFECQDDSADSENSLRRSTRVCALNAQKKLQNKEGMVDCQALKMENGESKASCTAPHLPAHTTAVDADAIESPKKKRKLSTGDGTSLDQYDCRFGIRLDPEGDVVMMTDESELSSLNSEEAGHLTEKWAELKQKTGTLTDDISREREVQIRNLEISLLEEEALLAMLKKTRTNQQLGKAKNEAARLLPNVAQNSTGAAYKPAMATPKLNGTAGHHNVKSTKTSKPRAGSLGNFQITPQQQQVLQKLIETKQLKPEHLAQLVQMGAPALQTVMNQLTQLHQKSIEAQQQQREQQEQQRRLDQQRREQEKRNAAAALAAVEAERQARDAAQNQQQRIQAARTQLRRHLESQLLQLPPPKAPQSDMTFIPNPNQPDFCYLLGLDLVVQRNLKDKTVFKKIDFEPYVCEECGTDFTPNWKAIAGDKGDLHVYCEQCVRQAQKRKVRNERTGLYKKVFQKIAEQEKEFERQVSAGKFNEPSQAATTSSAANSSSSSNGTHSSASKNAANFNAAALSGLANSSQAAKAINHTAASLAAAVGASQSAASLAARSFQANLSRSTPSNQRQDLKKSQTPSSANSQVSSQSRKRTAASSSSTNNVNLQLFAQLAQNPQLLQQFQQQATQMQLLRSNPMMLTALMQQPQLLQQMLQQRQQSSSSSSTNTSSANTGSSSTSTSSSSNPTPAQLMQQMMAASNLFGGAGALTGANHSSALNQLLNSNQQQLLRQMGGGGAFMQALQQMTAVSRKK